MELDKLWGLPRGDAQNLKFRAAYLNRMRRISAERRNVPPSDGPFEGSFFWHVDGELKFFEDGHR